MTANPASRPCTAARLATLAATLCLLAVPALAHDNDNDDGDDGDAQDGRFCSATTRLLTRACGYEAKDDVLKQRAQCLNLVLPAARKTCFDTAAQTHHDAQQLCRERRDARAALCGSLGEARYAPDFSAANFDTDFAHPTHANPYFPLQPGNRWAYEGGGESIRVEVRRRTKLIDGVTCVVVHDRVLVDGQLEEDTDDWYGQRKDGTVYYCGESSRGYEFFDGDRPASAELVSIDGSWKAGRDGDLPGVQMMAHPVVGAVYRQEFSPSNAEDAAQVLSTHYAYGHDAVLDQFVPEALARFLCSAGDCVVIGEFTPVEPSAFQRKYYAAGIGLFLDVTPATAAVSRLVDCNVDTRCAGLGALTPH